MTGPDVVVVGGGVIGLASAWRLSQAGATVAVYGSSPGASVVAAGMLTPVTEAYWGEEALLALTVASMRRWPDFATGLELEGGVPVGFEQRGVLAVGLDVDDRAVIDDLHRLHVEHGLRSERLSGRACREREPLLAPSVRGGLFAPDDAAVDPRRVVQGLRAALGRAGVDLVAVDVDRVVVDRGRACGVEVDGELSAAGSVVLAAGAWSSLVKGLPVEVVPPVRPVFGEVLRLAERLPDHAPEVVLRAVVRGRHVYVVPRSSGEIVVGATSVDRGYDTRVTAGGTYELLRDAQAMVPALAEAEVREATAGLRPGTPDNAPLIGRCGVDGLVLATGHYRNGILLAPVTADAVADMIVHGTTDPVVEAAAAATRFGSESP